MHLFIFILPFTLILFPDFLDHFLISLNNESSDISALFAVVDCACIPANLIVYVRISADRTDFNQLFQTQNSFLLRDGLQYRIVNYI